MKKEQVILLFIATVIGILVAGAIFYLYQSTRIVPGNKLKTISISSPPPTPRPSIFLTVGSPIDQEVIDTRTITVSGKTSSDAVVAILTQNSHQMVTPAGNGDFSVTLTISDGQNIIEITAIAPNGEEAKVTRTVTFSSEEF